VTKAGWPTFDIYSYIVLLAVSVECEIQSFVHTSIHTPTVTPTIYPRYISNTRMSSSIRNRVHTTPGGGGGGRTPSGSGSKDLASSFRQQQQQQLGEEYWNTWSSPRPLDDNGHSGEESVESSTAITTRRRRSSAATAVYPLHIQYQHSHHIPQQYTAVDNDGILSSPSYDNMGVIRTGKLLRAEKTRLEDYHVAYRTPHHVPDNAYRAYLQGRTGRSRRNSPFLTQVCCLHTCIGFSTVAVVFLCFVGILIDTQPLFMTGTLPKKLVETSNGRFVTKVILPAPGEVLPAARAAYRAALAYFFCIVLCLGALHPAWIQSQIYRVRHRYQDIPDHHDSVSPLLPDFHSANNGHDPITPHWLRTGWNRCSLLIRQRLAERGWYQTGAKHKKDRKTG